MKATDSGSAAATATVTVNVTNVNDVPSISASTYTVAENVLVGATVGTKTGTDGDGDTLAYTITAGNSAGLFAIDSSDGKITVAKALDYETATFHSLTVKATDSGSAAATATVTVNVTNVNDVTPSFSAGSYSKNLDNTVNTGTTVVDIDATDSDVSSDYNTIAYSITAGDSNSRFKINSTTGLISTAKALNTDSTTSYTLTVKATDGTNSATVNVAVTMLDKTPPVMIVTGITTVTHERGATYTDASVSVTDVFDNKILTVTTSGSVAVGTPGTYTLTYSATDAAGNKTTATRTVTVRDTVAPGVPLVNVASPTNDNTPEIGGTAEAGSTVKVYEGDTLLGQATADVTDGTYSITVSTLAKGSHSIVANAIDAAGNESVASTVVTVVVDLASPVISLVGEASVTVVLGGSYTEQWATATDDVDGNLDANIQVGGDVVNPGLIGTYSIKYNVSDAAGNAAATVSRTIVVQSAGGASQILLRLLGTTGTRPMSFVATN